MLIPNSRKFGFQIQLFLYPVCLRKRHKQIFRDIMKPKSMRTGAETTTFFHFRDKVIKLNPTMFSYTSKTIISARKMFGYVNAHACSKKWAQVKKC